MAASTSFSGSGSLTDLTGSIPRTAAHARAAMARGVRVAGTYPRYVSGQVRPLNHAGRSLRVTRSWATAARALRNPAVAVGTLRQTEPTQNSVAHPLLVAGLTRRFWAGYSGCCRSDCSAFKQMSARQPTRQPHTSSKERSRFRDSRPRPEGASLWRDPETAAKALGFFYVRVNRLLEASSKTRVASWLSRHLNKSRVEQNR